jgi:RimJ/RimL family protein N-acetyltransferase
MMLRPVTFDDAQFLFNLANDPTVRNMSFCSDPILWDTHVRWLKQKLLSPDWHIYIAMIPVGQIRFAVEGKTADVGVGRGIIRDGTAFFLHECRDVDGAIALVKEGNLASQGAFESAGYRLVGHETIKGFKCIVYEAHIK